ncbi:MAG: sulfurtransferase [Betaproteobacteria bacterium]
MFTTLVSTTDLAGMHGDPALVICDLRHDLARPDSWGEDQFRAGHIPGARFVHLDSVLSGPKTGANGRHPLPTPEVAAAKFARLGIGQHSQVVLYDQGAGMFASRMWWMLRWLGHDAAAVLDGGYAKWTAEQRPVATTTSPYAPAEFKVRKVIPHVDAAGIRASIARRTLLVIDARAPERFRGETEPLDPVAGHIPGARNRPASLNLDATGTFKAPAVLRAEFDALLDGASADIVVHQCGSGVTACHNMLAMEVAGYSGTRLYPGSWSEWCTDPSRPMATGAF